MNISEYYSWLKRDWAKVGFILSVFLFIFLFVLVLKEDIVLFILLLQTPLYMLHQTEEYVFPGGFGKFFNTKIFKIKTEDVPINQNFIFFLNILLVWIVLPVFALLSIIDYQYGLWIPYFVFFGGINHILLAIKAKKLYNPGLIVSLFVNIPIGLWSILFLIDKGVLNNFFLNPYIAIGLGINALLPALGMVLLKNYKRKQDK
ncbi:MAG: HXXEE domain-containing protein [Actinomycetota bacterium]|nr:HXXEE domain-containing protein [Actinomycetota bacterium]